MSPTPAREPTRRRRTRAVEPAGQGTWLDLGTPDDDAPDAPPSMADDAAPPEEPEWLRDAPVEPDLIAAPSLDPDAVAAALAERRAARAEEIVTNLNPEQARAVTTTDGPLLILAGAGSGKTRVVAHRIAYLIGVKAVQPRRILAVTFTNRAAGELRERIVALVGEPGKEVEAGTFHALCARVLRRDGEAIGLDRRFVIYDTDDQQQLMKRILAEEDLPATGEFRPAAILGAISRAKNDMLDEDFLAQNAVNHKERMIAKLAARYRERLRAANALDFDDLLLRAVELFEGAPEVLERYQARWRYLHVDEYQDTNRPQYLWVRALAAAHRNLCVVGDDDQSIYGWRGANIQNILDFERDYPDATVVKLEQNYRSTQLILDAAHAVVSRNERRTDKKLWTRNQGGVPIQRFEAYNEDEEAEWIARQVEGLVGSTGRGSLLTRRADDDESTRFRPKDVAVMYRMNAQSRAIEEAFLRYGIRYQLVGGTRFYQRREVKDALAYLRVLRSDTDVVSFERIINVPARGVGEKSIAALRRFAVTHGDDVWAAVQAGASGVVEGLGPKIRGALAGFARARPPPPQADRRASAPGASRRDPRGVRVPGDARRRIRRWRGPLGEPARAARGDAPLRGPLAGGCPRPPARGDGPGRRPGHLRGRGRRGHAHHAPRGQGAGVPGRVHRRDGGGPLPAQSGARRREGARGGAAPGLRWHHAGQATAVPLPRLAPGDLGRWRHEHPVTVPARDPAGADDRAAARSGRRHGLRPGPGHRVPGARVPVRGRCPRRRRGVPAGERPAWRPAGGGDLPPDPGPRGEAGRVRGWCTVWLLGAAAPGPGFGRWSGGAAVEPVEPAVEAPSRRGRWFPASAATATGTAFVMPAGATAS